LEENFPDAQLFSVQIDDEYFVDIIECLSTRIGPQAFSITQKKNLVVKAAGYQLIVGHLYNMGAEKKFRSCVL
jgi:hypothetical protein